MYNQWNEPLSMMISHSAQGWCSLFASQRAQIWNMLKNPSVMTFCSFPKSEKSLAQLRVGAPYISFSADSWNHSSCCSSLAFYLRLSEMEESQKRNGLTQTELPSAMAARLGLISQKHKGRLWLMRLASPRSESSHNLQLYLVSRTLLWPGKNNKYFCFCRQSTILV